MESGPRETRQAPASSRHLPLSQQRAPRVSTSGVASSAAPLAAPPSGEAAGTGVPPSHPRSRPCGQQLPRLSLWPLSTGSCSELPPLPGPSSPVSEGSLRLRPEGMSLRSSRLDGPLPAGLGRVDRLGQVAGPQSWDGPFLLCHQQGLSGGCPLRSLIWSCWSGQCNLGGKSLGLEMCFLPLCSRGDGG